MLVSQRCAFDLTLLLVNYKSAADLLKCFRSLGVLRDNLRCQFIVVDNSPPDAACLLTKSEFPNVPIIESENVGYAAACNRGLRESRAPYVLFLNPDTEFVSGSVLDVIRLLERESSIALVGPRILNSDGTRQFSCRSFPSWTTAFCHRYSLLTKILPQNPFSSQYLLSGLDGHVTDVDWVSGCCFLARKEALERVGGFDESYFLFFEDVDLAHRLKLRGWRCVYYPALAFSHALGRSRLALPDQGSRFKHLSIARYFAKNVIQSQWLARVFSGAVYARGRISSFTQILKSRLRGRSEAQLS